MSQIERTSVDGDTLDGPCFKAVPVSPVIVHLRAEEQCSIDECNSGSNISECSENGVTILINPIDTEYADRPRYQEQREELVSPVVSETYVYVQADEVEQYQGPSKNSCPQMPMECQSFCSDCAACSQCTYDVTGQDYVQSSPYGFNNSAQAVPYVGTIQVPSTDGAADLVKPPQYLQQVVYAPPPCIQEQAQPIYFVPPPQAEEWVVTNGYDQMNFDAQPADIYSQADVDYYYQEPLEDLPAIHISGVGMITVLLRDDLAIEMTLDRSIRAINQRYNSVISVTNDGRETCVFHKGATIKQKNNQVDAELFHSRRITMNDTDVNLAFEDMAFNLSRDTISPVPFSVFPEFSEGDDTVGLIYTSTGVHPHLIPACEEAIKDSRYTREKNGCVIVDVNGVRIRQEKNGDVIILSAPKRIRMSPTTAWIGIQTDFVSMSIGEYWDVSIQCGKNVLSASNQHMFYVNNGWATAGIDVNKRLFTFRQPDKHHRRYDGHRRPMYPGMRPPPPRYLDPPPPFSGFRPRGGPPMRYQRPPHGPPMRWSGPRDIRKIHPPMYPPPPRFYRNHGNDRGGRRHHSENQTWRHRDRQPEPREERPQSPDSSEQTPGVEKTEKKEHPQPRKRVKNFKREQTRDTEEAETDVDATD